MNIKHQHSVYSAAGRRQSLLSARRRSPRLHCTQLSTKSSPLLSCFLHPTLQLTDTFSYTACPLLIGYLSITQCNPELENDHLHFLALPGWLSL